MTAHRPPATYRRRVLVPPPRLGDMPGPTCGLPLPGTDFVCMSPNHSPQAACHATGTRHGVHYSAFWWPITTPPDNPPPPAEPTPRRRLLTRLWKATRR